MNKSIAVLLLLSLTISPGCNSSGDEEAAADFNNTHDIVGARLSRDMQRLQSFSRELNDQEQEMQTLREIIGLKERGHYTSDEHDKIENLLFRFLVCRESLWEIVDYYRDYRDHFSDENDQVKGFIIGFDAALHLAYYSSLLVATFLENDVVIDKLNEEYYRSDIPGGTYDNLLASLTKIEHMEALKTAWELYSTEMADHESHLYKISQSNPDYKSAADQVSSLYSAAEKRIEYVLEKKSLLLPEVRNRLRHSVIVELARKVKEEIGDNLYAARGILFVNVSRIKSPTAVNIRFSEKQLAYMKKLLKPGDIVLTYSAGYMSNVFLPGKFKHGITYVGLPEERREAGLTGIALAEVPEEKVRKFEADLEVAGLESGHDADMIEAVAEGVIFNSLEAIVDEHIARLCVLRPRLKRNALIDTLTTVFLLLGNSYDFKFDFIDGSRQCCTEVIYRALHKHGPIDFNLTKRMGVWTLCADDIVNYYLSSEEGSLDFVLYAEESDEYDGNAVILSDSSGRRRLAALMRND